MAIEKVTTDNGVDIYVKNNEISLSVLDIESPMLSPHITFSTSEWEVVKNFIDNKIKENGDK